jgi:hypothetical protein
MLLKTVPKAWGRETWIVNEPQYCAKWLEILPGWQCSKHYHPIKTESFMGHFGTTIVEVWPKFPAEGPPQEIVLESWDVLHLLPFTPHRFRNDSIIDPTVLLEISTHHNDDDVVRLEESREI